MPNNQRHRILFWNIRHGGGSRAGKIVEQIALWNPDIVALAEFRGTSPSKSISRRLHDLGFLHQLTTVDIDNPSWNALLLASRYKLTSVNVIGAPDTDLYWLLCACTGADSISYRGSACAMERLSWSARILRRAAACREELAIRFRSNHWRYELRHKLPGRRNRKLIRLQ